MSAVDARSRKSDRNAMSSAIEAMRNPSFYAPSPRTVAVCETHISWVFIAGKRVYKVKKPVKLPFLDYSSLERRRAMCELEVQLNRRLARDIYVGVRKIVSAKDGYAITDLEDPAPALEYAVEMRYVDPAHRLDQLIANDAPELVRDISRVGRSLATFHAAAPPAQAGTGDPDTIHGWIKENLDEVRREARGLEQAVDLRATERALTAFIGNHGAVLGQRRLDGFIRDGHGDLRREHIVIGPEIAVLDCIEFNPDLRQIDVAADLAFLVMDLYLVQRERLAQTLCASYSAANGDYGAPSLLFFYATLRAVIRAKVLLIRAKQKHADRAGNVEQAMRHLDLAEPLRWQMRRPLAIALCGVSGSGKSFLAHTLSTRSGFPHINSDVVRKELAGLAPSQRAAPNQYSSEFSRRTYNRLADLAVEEVSRFGGVFVDATFRQRRDRARFAERLIRADLEPVFVECRAPRNVLKDRVNARVERGGDPSDARPYLVDEQLEEFEAFCNETFKHDWVDTTLPLDELVDAVETVLDGSDPASTESARR